MNGAAGFGKKVPPNNHDANSDNQKVRIKIDDPLHLDESENKIFIPLENGGGPPSRSRSSSSSVLRKRTFKECNFEDRATTNKKIKHESQDVDSNKIVLTFDGNLIDKDHEDDQSNEFENENGTILIDTILQQAQCQDARSE